MTAPYVSSLILITLPIAGVFAASPSLPVVSPVQEVVLGEKAVAKFMNERGETTDAVLAARVDAIGRQLSGFTDRPEALHRALVMKGIDRQAFAFPGNTIAVTEGLARLLDDDELAFALAHEMAHVDLRHQLSHVVEEAVMRETASRSTAGAALSLKDRHAEFEADRFGTLYAVRAGFQFSAAGRVLKRLEAQGGIEQDAMHPDFSDRIRALSGFESELRRAIDAFGRGSLALTAGETDDAVQYLTLFVAEFPESVAGRVNLGAAYLARWRGVRASPEGLAEALPILPDPGVQVRGAFGDADGRDARSHFEAALRVDPNSVPARIGIAMILLRQGLTSEAIAFLRPAENDPKLRPEVLLLLGNAEFLGGAWPEAASHYALALSARPGWNPAQENLTRALVKSEKQEQAQSLGDAIRYP